MYFVHYGQEGKLVTAPVRYLVQAWETWCILNHEKPDVILLQNPPIFLVLVAFFYSRLYPARYIIDSHTGAFLSMKWRWSIGLHRMLSKSALITLVHNKSQEEIVKTWNCRYMVLGYTPGEYPEGEKYPLSGDFKVAVIGSILENEPMDVVLKAVNLMPDIKFYITGDTKRIDPHVLTNKPENCYLTGYISYEKYVGLLRDVDVIMTLTTRDHTLLMGGFEAISLEKPVIVSDWPILRDFFPQGAVFVMNTAEGLHEGVYKSRQEKETLKLGIASLHKQLDEQWERQLSELRQLVHEGHL